MPRRKAGEPPKKRGRPPSATPATQRTIYVPQVIDKAVARLAKERKVTYSRAVVLLLGKSTILKGGR